MADANQSESPSLVTLDDIEAAARQIAPLAVRTPLRFSHALSGLVGRDVWLKAEYQQRTGSFKIRGAFNRISRLDPGTSVVAASAGNHAQGVALAARHSGLDAVIYMPDSAPLPKVLATEGYGAAIRFAGATVDDAIAAARADAEATGATFVPPFDDPFIIAGQGTAGLEVTDDMPEGATVVIPVGGGGLIAGMSAALRSRGHRGRIVGVEPTGAASMAASLDVGQVVTLDAMSTIADGVALKCPSALTLAHTRAFVDEIVVVGDPITAEALVLLAERAKAVVEPSGALPLAALLADLVPGDEPVVLMLSGGNVDPLLLAKLIDYGLSAAGRYLRMTVTVPDRPGQLARLTVRIADLGANVLTVEHHREGLHLDMGHVEITLTVETRGPAHRDDIVAALRSDGFGVELER